MSYNRSKQICSKGMSKPFWEYDNFGGGGGGGGGKGGNLVHGIKVLEALLNADWSA